MIKSILRCLIQSIMRKLVYSGKAWLTNEEVLEEPTSQAMAGPSTGLPGRNAIDTEHRVNELLVVGSIRRLRLGTAEVEV